MFQIRAALSARRSITLKTFGATYYTRRGFAAPAIVEVETKSLSSNYSAIDDLNEV